MGAGASPGNFCRVVSAILSAFLTPNCQLEGLPVLPEKREPNRAKNGPQYELNCAFFALHPLIPNPLFYAPARQLGRITGRIMSVYSWPNCERKWGPESPKKREPD